MSWDPHLSLSLAKVAKAIEVRKEALRKEIAQLDRNADQVVAMVALCERLDIIEGPANLKNWRIRYPAQQSPDAVSLPGQPRGGGRGLAAFAEVAERAR